MVDKGGFIDILPELARDIGINEVVILSYVHRELSSFQVVASGIESLKVTYDEIQDNLKIMSVSTIKRAVKSLHELGLLYIYSEYNSMDKTNAYKINYDRLIYLNDKAVEGSD